MGKTINTQIDDGRLRFEIGNAEGEVFSSFRMNPTDVNMIKRCQEVADFFANEAKDAPTGATPEEAAAFNAMIEEKFNYMLGYDASKSLFAELTATTLLPDGRIFALAVMDIIGEAIKPELAKRKKAMQKYTAKYGK